MNKTLEQLTKNNIEFTLDVDGNICGLSFNLESKMTDKEAWDLVNKNHMKTQIITAKPTENETITPIEDIKAQIDFLAEEIKKYD